MRYLALASDYDDTLATGGQVSAATLRSLERLRRSGRRLILVTGRELDDLLRLFPGFGLFDRIVAENGGLLHNPLTGETRQLAEAPPAELVRELSRCGVVPLSAGRVVVATRRIHEQTVLDTLQRLGLEAQVTFNRTSLMLLPPGIDKASGLAAALDDLELSLRDCIGIGDAENDVAFLEVCGFTVAVANAIPSLREESDLVTKGSRGDGVSEIIDILIRMDSVRTETPAPRVLASRRAGGTTG